MTQLQEEIEERLNHSWDGKLYAYNDNACAYVDVTDIVLESNQDVK